MKMFEDHDRQHTESQKSSSYNSADFLNLFHSDQKYMNTGTFFTFQSLVSYLIDGNWKCWM